MADQSDQQLLRRIQQGDRRAYEYLIQRYERPLFNFAARFLGDRDAAADMCQQTFIQFFTHVNELHADDALAPWLFRVIRNRCLDDLRRQRTTTFSQVTGDADAEDGPSALERIADHEPLPAELAEREDLQRILQAAIADLPVMYREVVALRYGVDLSFAEIGLVLGLPEATAKTRFHRAKPLLREYLRRQGITAPG